MESQTCPDDVKTRALILNANGFHGWNGIRYDNFIICLCDVEDKLEEIKLKSGSSTLEQGYFLEDYLSIHWSEYNKIETILNTILQSGFSFTTQNRAQVYFNHEKNKEFTFEIMEKRAICQAYLLLENGLMSMVDDSFCEEWNYITEIGQQFASLFLKCKSYHYDDTRTNYYEWDIFQNYDKNTLMTP